MAVSERVGVLLPASVMQRLTHQKPSWESVVEYTRAAKRLNLEAVLFTLGGYDPRHKTVRGYVRRGGKWTPWQGNLPAVVHNRTIAMTPRAIRLMRTLSRQLSDGLFNPAVSRDKWGVWRRLARNDRVRDYLPATSPLTERLGRMLPRLVKKYGSLVIKPRFGSLGLGIVFIEPVAGQPHYYRWVPTKGRPRIVHKRTLLRLIQPHCRPRRYIIQDAIPLMRYRGRRCDLRVPVQRNGHGQWTVMSATVKQATKHRYLTNIARGGRAHDDEFVLAAAFGARHVSEIRAEIKQLSLAVAEQLSKHIPSLADLGLDIGLDRYGKPWLIEVNFRDQRLCSKRARQVQTHAQLYHNPISYAHYLLRRRQTAVG